MDLGLGRRRAVVSGASRGIGRAIALALAAEGAEVIAVARWRRIERARGGRFDHSGEADEFAAMAAFLASPRASYITGSVIRVDGGMIRSV